MVKIDTKTYKIKEGSYYSTRNRKKQIILADSLRKENLHIKRYQHKDFGKTKSWPTFSISREGKIFQHYNPSYYTDFFGDKLIDKQSISIILENMGMLSWKFTKNKYTNWALDECDDLKIYEKEWKGCNYWESYTNEQFISCAQLCDYLIGKYKISRDCIGYNNYDEEAKKFEGIVTRSNFDQDYRDVNPSFDFRLFLNKLNIPII